MKRSEINAIMAEADAMMARFGFTLPPFARWDAAQLRSPEARTVLETRLGWDITDYGAGDFARMGLFLFTLRNGRAEELRPRGMAYAEKLLISRRDQLSPMHTHIDKVEDIINRGGADLAVQLYGSDAQGRFDPQAGGVVICDGVARPFAAGEVLRLRAGESVTLRPGDWHAFWGEGGDVLIGEVSTVNNDLTDNIFREPIGRFAQIEEDVAPLHWLVADYERFL